MEPNLVLIFGFIIVIFVVMMRTITAATERQMAHKERLAELKGAAGGLDADAAARIENMEQRLRVLERIATDGNATPSADLAREIEALRHAQDLEDHGTGMPLNLKEKVQ